MAAFSPKIAKTGRHLNEILDMHWLAPEFFKDKLILDAGAGHSVLHSDLNEIGVNCTVVSLDGFLPSLRKANVKRGRKRPLPVQGDITAMPFPDEVFDVLIATYSLPFWARSAEHIRKFFDESRRVLKPEGILSVYPMRIEGDFICNDPNDVLSQAEKKRTLNTIQESLLGSPEWVVDGATEIGAIRVAKAVPIS